MDVLGRLGAERARELRVQRLVRPVVVPADHVRDPEVDVVHDRGELVGGAAVLPHERHRRRAGRAELLGRLPVALSALGLAHRPVVPLDPEPRRSSTIASSPPGTFRAGSVSSIRKSIQSPKPRFATAESALPMCSVPVGLGAKRTRFKEGGSRPATADHTIGGMKRVVVLGAVVVVIVAALAAVRFAWPSASISAEADGLPTVHVPALAGKVVRVSLHDARGNEIPVDLRDDVFRPAVPVVAGSRLIAEAVVRRPGYVGWLRGRDADRPGRTRRPDGAHSRPLAAHQRPRERRVRPPRARPLGRRPHDPPRRAHPDRLARPPRFARHRRDPRRRQPMGAALRPDPRHVVPARPGPPPRAEDASARPTPLRLVFADRAPTQRSRSSTPRPPAAGTGPTRTRSSSARAATASASTRESASRSHSAR